MRALSDYLAKEFAARGIRLAAHQLIEGRQRLTFESDGRLNDIIVGPFASDAEIWAAIRKAFNMTDDNIETVPEAPTPTADKMPAVDLAPPVEKPKAAKPIPAGSHPPGTLSGLLQALKNRKAAVMDSAITEAMRAHKALDHVERVTGDMTATTDGIMSELGQFSNFAEDEP